MLAIRNNNIVYNMWVIVSLVSKMTQFKHLRTSQMKDLVAFDQQHKQGLKFTWFLSVSHKHDKYVDVARTACFLTYKSAYF